MKRKLIFLFPFMLLCFILLSAHTFAMYDSDIQIKVTSPVNGLINESGVIAVEHFPAEITVMTTAKVGNLTGIEATFNKKTEQIEQKHVIIVQNKEECGTYTIKARTDEGAVLTICVNVVFQVKATNDIRYRTLGINLREVYDDQNNRIKVFQSPQFIKLENANTVDENEKEHIAELIGRRDGKTYILKGSLFVDVHVYAAGRILGKYDVDKDYDNLTSSFNWTPKTIDAYITMRSSEIAYQAPVGINIDATWCSENKKEVYGRLTAKDKGVPEYLYPYQTTSVTFSKDDIPLSRNFIYKGLEWDYSPETDEYTDGESETKESITQKINYMTPAADFYFKFKKQDGNDLLVSINAPTTVYRGDYYSFDVIFTNTGSQPAYDVPLKGRIDEASIKEIQDLQDFAPNESKTYTIKRKADTSASKIHLWANIGVPEGFIDSNLSNNTAAVEILVIDKSVLNPSQTPEPEDNPDKPEPKKLCDLSVSIFEPPTVYEHEEYSFTVKFTNCSGKELINVALKGSNNDAALGQIPKYRSFKPNESVSYKITGKAGNKGDIYHLWANVEATYGFKDEFPSNNSAVSKITVIGKTPENQIKNEEPPEVPGKPPEDPYNPLEDPDIPEEKLCDLWVNISSPPTVYEQEEYNFTVYFTNDTDKDISGVRITASVDDKLISEVPSTASFNAHETKTFSIKGKAGNKLTSIELEAQASVPQEFTDTNISNNTVKTEIQVVERPYDLKVEEIFPDKYKENQTVITTIKISNKGRLDFTPGQKVDVLFEIPELSISKRVNAVVMKSDTYNIVSVKWDTPDITKDRNITLIATIDPGNLFPNESSSGNNILTKKAVIQNVKYDKPKEVRTVPPIPIRQENPRVEWSEQRYKNGRFVWKDFYAELRVNATIDYETKKKGSIKSGYGFTIKVTPSVVTNYDRPELITVPQTAEVYLPQHLYQTAIPLMAESPSYFTFRENPASPDKHKKQYVPVWFPDNKDYIIQLLVTDVHTPGGTLSKWISGGELEMKVIGNMYSDDVTTAS